MKRGDWWVGFNRCLCQEIAWIGRQVGSSFKLLMEMVSDCVQTTHTQVLALTNSMAYGTRRFNGAFTRALQKFLF